MLSLAYQQSAFCDIAVANISRSCTRKMAATASWRRNYVAVMLCMCACGRRRCAYCDYSEPCQWTLRKHVSMRHPGQAFKVCEHRFLTCVSSWELAAELIN